MRTWTKFHTMWTMSLFGTAVGAGILFLPIQAGMGGMWPLIIMTLLVGPMTYYSHRALSRFVLASSKPGSDFTEVVEEFFGQKAGFLVTLLYFFAIFPFLLVYGVGMTNSVESFIVHQLGMASPSRVILGTALSAILVGIFLLGEKTVIKVTEIMVYPLCIMLLLLSLSLIPHWNFEIFSSTPATSLTWQGLLATFLLTIPVLVFSFEHFPAISSFAKAIQEKFPNEKVQQSDKILRITAALLLFFTMFFVFSCLLCLSHEDLLEAKEENIAIISYLANKLGAPFISWFGPFISILAIGSSFFGHYLGAREGLEGLTHKTCRLLGKTANISVLHKLMPLFFFVSISIAAIENPSILDIISTLGGPIVALILFIMPMYAIHTVPAMRPYAKKWSNIFVTFMGLVAIAGLFYNIGLDYL